MPAIKKLMDEVLSGSGPGEAQEGPLAVERGVVANAKKIALFVAGGASQKYMQAIADQQEIMGALADMILEVYVMESAVLRAQKLAAVSAEAASLPTAMAQIYLAEAMERIEASAKRVLAAIAEGDGLRVQMAILRRLAKHTAYNTLVLKQQVAGRVIEAGRYVI
jgi:butyryl-CoA dehydrogenase